MFNSGNKPPLNRRLVHRMARRDRRTLRLEILLYVAGFAMVLSPVSWFFGVPRSLALIAFSMTMLICALWGFSWFHAAGRILGSSMCRMCGYDLEGVGDAPACPECGSDAGMMRSTLPPDAERRAERDARIRRVMIPVVLAISFWPLALFSLYDFAMEVAPNDVVMLVILVAPMAIWVAASTYANFCIRNIARWRRYQADMARKHADASPA